MSALRILRFEPLRLHLEAIGPIRELRTFSFVTKAGPANLLMVMGPNGSGKTSVLESVFTAYAMLAGRTHTSFGLEALDEGRGALQLDVRAHLMSSDGSVTVALSIVLNSDPLFVHSTSDLDADEVERQAALIFRKGRDGSVSVAPASDPLATDVVDAVATATGTGAVTLFGQDLELPTALYFPTLRGLARNDDAIRSVARPPNLEYHPARRFGLDGGTWASSIDNLFAWFTWLGDGRAESCRDLANELVFKGRPKRLGSVDRQELRLRVETDAGTHRIDQLSHGERQLLQLVVRIASHMTRSTVVLIDEAELHLHLVLRRRLMVLLKRWAVDYQGLSFMLTSHQTDMLRVFGPKYEEDGLRKGGFVLKQRQQDIA